MNENRMKAINGRMCKHRIIDLLKRMQSDGIITYCQIDYRNGYDNFSKSQFYVPFYVEFSDSTSWLLFSTNSIRTDRICIQQWNAEHIRIINPSVESALLLVPDELKQFPKELNEVEKYKEKIHNKIIFSSIDDVVFHSELEGLVRARKNNNKGFEK